MRLALWDGPLEYGNACLDIVSAGGAVIVSCCNASGRKPSLTPARW